MEKLHIAKLKGWNWIIQIENKHIMIDCFREKDTLDKLEKIERDFEVPEWYLTFEFIGKENSFQATLKDWVLSITN